MNLRWLLRYACDATLRHPFLEVLSPTAAVQMLVSALKQELSGITNIPAERQRLIYKGRVVRDDQNLNELGTSRLKLL